VIKVSTHWNERKAVKIKRVNLVFLIPGIYMFLRGEKTKRATIVAL
jgi:hypothetical protein